MDPKIFFIFFSLCMCMCVCNGYLNTLENSTNPEFPGKCWDPETEKAYDLKEEFFVKKHCTKGTCYEGFSIEYQGCSVVSVEGCKTIDRDFNLPYPKCCQQYQCEDGTILPGF